MDAGASNFQRKAIPKGETIVMGTDRRVYNVQCNNCNAWGHYSRECPTASSTVSSRNRYHNARNNKRNRLNYILDTGSTHTTVNDNRDLTNVFKSKILRMTSSTGNTIDYAYEGTLMPFNVKAHYNR